LEDFTSKLEGAPLNKKKHKAAGEIRFKATCRLARSSLKKTPKIKTHKKGARGLTETNRLRSANRDSRMKKNLRERGR